MMKIAFINPKVGLFNEYNLIAETAENIPTIGNFTYRDEMTPPEISLLHMASISKKYGYNPIYLDFNLDSKESELSDLTLAVINLTTHQCEEGYLLSKKLMQEGVKVGFFGPHATALPDEAFKNGNAIFVGEGELPFEEWLKQKKDGIYGPYPPLNLDDLPLPAYEILNSSNHRLIPLLSSRGCNRGCTYCWQILTALNKYRVKSPEKLEEDIKYAESVLNTDHFLFVDDNMFIDENHGLEILKTVKKHKIRWSCQTDIHIYKNDELLNLIKEAGCMRMLIGFESISSKSMKEIAMYKSSQIDDFSRAIEKIQKKGISIVGSFILGFDGDSEEEYERLEKFLMKNILGNVSISILAPPPGTPLFKKLKKEKRLLTYNWKHYNQCSVIFIPDTISKEKLENWVKRIFSLVQSPEFRKRRIKYFLELSREKS